VERAVEGALVDRLRPHGARVQAGVGRAGGGAGLGALAAERHHEGDADVLDHLGELGEVGVAGGVRVVHARRFGGAARRMTGVRDLRSAPHK
jgi:hypothetical protein